MGGKLKYTPNYDNSSVVEINGCAVLLQILTPYWQTTLKLHDLCLEVSNFVC